VLFQNHLLRNVAVDLKQWRVLEKTIQAHYTNNTILHKLRKQNTAQTTQAIPHKLHKQNNAAHAIRKRVFCVIWRIFFHLIHSVMYSHLQTHAVLL